MQKWFRERAKRVRTWWRAPATVRDRTSGMIVGGMAGFWIGALGRILVGQLPVGIGAVLLCGLAGIIAGAIFGRLCPKVALVLLLPLATFGCSPS
ncbi:hypothetical protein [Dokdonella fugitiva]|jgi:hypothetical protein|uniref:Uncharacterized protein n=1 Tax=Dokdonella fugitiva TaxID=328517 RepID=A0A4R2HTV5_9GAMM|nr:hypothetical protein [Dokdonella fugitiva]MBA8884909.1 hypothetical protein [Dokdonella fugitiva]TCO34831.1 hypothetical protein EV148_11611 [Dokdonella fugitiva]